MKVKNLTISITMEEEEIRKLAQIVGVSEEELTSEVLSKYIYKIFNFKEKKVGKKSKLEDKDLEYMQKMINEGETYKNIALKYNVSPSYISTLISRKKLCP